MKPTVNILITIRDPALVEMSLLVLDTIRRGFPTWDLHLFGNGLTPDQIELVQDRLERNGMREGHGIHLVNLTQRMRHPQWIQHLIDLSPQPIFIVDTDVIFWRSLQDWFDPTRYSIIGRHVPEFRDPLTLAVQEERLHTSLLYLDCPRLRPLISHYSNNVFPNTEFTPVRDLIEPLCHVRHGEARMFDCCAQLVHAFPSSCHEFSEDELNCYDHLQCGTLLTMAEWKDRKFVEQLQLQHEAILGNPELARGLWRAHDEFYQSNKP